MYCTWISDNALDAHTCTCICACTLDAFALSSSSFCSSFRRAESFFAFSRTEDYDHCDDTTTQYISVLLTQISLIFAFFVNILKVFQCFNGKHIVLTLLNYTLRSTLNQIVQNHKRLNKETTKNNSKNQKTPSMWLIVDYRVGSWGRQNIPNNQHINGIFSHDYRHLVCS